MAWYDALNEWSRDLNRKLVPFTDKVAYGIIPNHLVEQYAGPGSGVDYGGSVAGQVVTKTFDWTGDVVNHFTTNAISTAEDAVKAPVKELFRSPLLLAGLGIAAAVVAYKVLGD